MEKEMRINHTDYKGGNNESSKRGPVPPSSRAACFPEMTELKFNPIDTRKEIRLSTFENIDEATRAWQEGQARVHKGKGIKRARLGSPLQPGRVFSWDDGTEV